MALNLSKIVLEDLKTRIENGEVLNKKHFVDVDDNILLGILKEIDKSVNSTEEITREKSISIILETLGQTKQVEETKSEEETKPVEETKSKEETKPVTFRTSIEDSNEEEIMLLKIDRLSKRFGDKEVLKSVDLEIKTGETVALVGANGAGKTVLSEIIAGLTTQTSGKIIFNPETKLNPKDEIGFQFQEADMPPKISVKGIIKFYKSIYQERVNQIQLEDMIDLFGIRDFYKKRVGKLSGGQKQRVNLLLSVMHSPKFIILDEFITGLDINSVKNILEFVKEIQVKNNSTLLVITHQPDEIKMLADRVVVLKAGRINNIYQKEDILKNWDTYSEFLMEVI